MNTSMQNRINEYSQMVDSIQQEQSMVEFTDPTQAALHFGTSERQRPSCQVSPDRLRELEALLDKYCDEDTNLHRELRKAVFDSSTAARRAEEQGYAKALSDIGYAALTAAGFASVEALIAAWKANEQDARRLEWYFSPSDKTAFLSGDYMKGMCENWNTDKWRAAIDAALAAPSPEAKP